MSEAVDYFEQASEMLTNNSRVFYNLAIAHQTVGNPLQAEAAYKRAIELKKENGDFRYGLVTLYMQQEQYEKALHQAEELNRRSPNNPQLQRLVRMIEENLN
jgi:tetratricopeptide (TPR) repeat protein